MYAFFGGVSKLLVPDNCKTAVIHNTDWYTPKLNTSYQELATHYDTAVLPARVRKPKDKSSAEGNVGHISTWIIAALRNEQFFSLAELNTAIQERMDAWNHRTFQKRDGSPYECFLREEKPCLADLPAYPFEIAEWKTATVQYNYHISIDGMLYSVPYEYIRQSLNVRMTDNLIEVYVNHNRIASHVRLHGRKGQYSTQQEHMPKSHQKFLEWSGDRFRTWAKSIGDNTYQVIDAILSSHSIEQQGYRSCSALLHLAEKHGSINLENVCKQALTFTSHPSYKGIKNLLATQKPLESETPRPQGLTRGSAYFTRRMKRDD